MKLSADRIPTTHVGSLPRPRDVVDLIFAQDRNEPVDAAVFDSAVRCAMAGVIRMQVENGVDIPSDGEQSKISYGTCIRHRLTGFEGDSQRPTPQDLDDFPDYRRTACACTCAADGRPERQVGQVSILRRLLKTARQAGYKPAAGFKPAPRVERLGVGQ
jgi:5-methyltetrahydropteroyltriglutamate--homocysteine methyltransferase